MQKELKKAEDRSEGRRRHLPLFMLTWALMNQTSFLETCCEDNLMMKILRYT
jgi:hypothetical protein